MEQPVKIIGAQETTPRLILVWEEALSRLKRVANDEARWARNKLG